MGPGSWLTASLWPVKAWKAAGSPPSSGSRRPAGVSLISTAPTGSAKRRSTTAPW